MAKLSRKFRFKGIMGILTLMGLNLEPIMMAAVLISMGFSVDIPAHVTYHYNSKGKSLLIKIANSLRLEVDEFSKMKKK